MPQVRGLVPFVVCGLLLACQGDQNLPSDPGRDLGLTAGVCKSEDFTAYTQAMYTSSSLERARLQQCKTAMAAEDNGNLVKAEAAVNAILVAIYQDYVNSNLTTFPGDGSLEESVIDYMAFACTLGGLTPGEECLIPDATTDLTEDLWVAVGPLAAGGTGELPNDQFGFRVDGGKGVYVFVSSRQLTTFLGSCPGTSENDCQNDVYDLDADGTFTTITVESCEQFDTGRLRHMHCPDDGECEFGEPSPAPGLITCTLASTGFRGFLNVATKPVQWIIHATPAYAAGLGTKFTSFSPVVVGDMDPRARGVVCSFETQYQSTSAGTICELFEQGTATPAQCAPFDENGNGEPCSCTSEPEESTSTMASCSLSPKVPATVGVPVTYDVTARKTGGTGGAYYALWNVTLAADSPPRGGSNTVCFRMDSPESYPIDCQTRQRLP